MFVRVSRACSRFGNVISPTLQEPRHERAGAAEPIALWPVSGNMKKGSSFSRMVVVTAIKPERRKPYALVDRVQIDWTFQERIGTIQAGIRKGRKPRIAKRQG